MINYQKDDYDGSLEDIMSSINDILNNTGEGYETDENIEINGEERVNEDYGKNKENK